MTGFRATRSGASFKTLSSAARRSSVDSKADTARTFAAASEDPPPAAAKCSAMGPSANTGKNVNAPTMTMTPTTSIVKSGPSVGKVPGPGGAVFFPATLPAIASAGRSSRSGRSAW
jgi:hypothetical protein